MSSKVLALYLDAPMQSWGASSRYQIRDTGAFPTKSGVIGMIAAALGIDKEDSEEASRIQELAGLRIGVRRLQTDRKTPVHRLTDFHTVGGGYDTSRNSPDRLFVTRKASGGPSGTVITRRTYLTDVKFLVFLEGNPDLLAKCRQALRNPVWGVWFGRKACLPAAPLFPTLGDSFEDAFQKLCDEMQVVGELRIDPDGQIEETGDGAWYAEDEPVSFKERTYRARPVKRG